MPEPIAPKSAQAYTLGTGQIYTILFFVNTYIFNVHREHPTLI